MIIVVIVLFIVLAYKIYKNTRMMRGTDEKSTHDTAEDYMHDFVDQPILWAKLAKGIEASSPDEEVSITLMLNAVFQGFESQCAEAEAGKLDDGEIQALEEAVHRICAMPGVQKHLADMKADLSPRLQSIIDQKQ